jgi:competence protein ComEA
MKSLISKSIGAALILVAVLSFAGFSQAGDTFKINLNEASIQELVKVKGIGQKYAERIVAYRENNGKFKRVEDIMKIKGIGKKKYESIKDTIIVDTEEVDTE